jgi:hypothetical protein
VNPYGVAALSGLAGLFSKQATDKLREVFETLFRVARGAGDAQRKDDLGDPAPVIAKLDPSSIRAGSTGVVVKVAGECFATTTVVRIDGTPQKTKYVNARLLQPTLDDALVAKPARLTVTAFTGPPGGGESEPLTLDVLA